MTREINKLILSRIKQLLLEHRDTYRVDLHLHTLYSSDGTQTVLQALKKAKEKHIDIVSIADHDSIRAYSEIMKIIILTTHLYQLLFRELNLPYLFQSIVSVAIY